MPVWSHLHPAIVHFPIALLLMVPLLVVLGLLWPRQRTGIHVCALALLILGTVAAFLAVITGQAVPGPIAPSVALRVTLAAHEQLGKRTFFLFGGLSLAFLLIQALAWFSRMRISPSGWLVLHLIWLTVALSALLPLIRTGQLGGRMVHELGIHGPSLP